MIPSAVFSEPPTTLFINFLLADFFNTVEIESLRIIDPQDWQENSADVSPFSLYECRISEKTTAKNFLAWAIHGKEYSSAYISPETTTLLELPSIQSRLA
jgi:hypothetical protein